MDDDIVDMDAIIASKIEAAFAEVLETNPRPSAVRSKELMYELIVARNKINLTIEQEKRRAAVDDAAHSLRKALEAYRGYAQPYDADIDTIIDSLDTFGLTEPKKSKGRPREEWPRFGRRVAVVVERELRSLGYEKHLSKIDDNYSLLVPICVKILAVFGIKIDADSGFTAAMKNRRRSATEPSFDEWFQKVIGRIKLG